MFHDIGDYLDHKQKLGIIRDFEGLSGISQNPGWVELEPDDQNDWLNQRDVSFDNFMKIGDKKDKSGKKLFSAYSLGINSNRDAWVFNSSQILLTKNMSSMIDVYNDQVGSFSKKPEEFSTADFIETDTKKIKWSSSLIYRLERGQEGHFSGDSFSTSIYRPFQKLWLYYDKMFVHRTGQMPSIFPSPSEMNLVISVPSPGNVTPFSALMSDVVQDLSVVAAKAGTQCFPLYLYDQQDEEPGGLFEGQSSGLRRRDAITDAGLEHFRAAYPGEEITKEDIFYYVYGLLHSEDYRTRYADNLTKELPRIPCVKTYADFRAFTEAGRRLGDLHVNYETVEPYPVTYKQGDPRTWVIEDPKAFFRVTKWKFGGKGRDKDRTTVVYNANITMTDVPLEAYDYVVNGKPALEWVMERQVVKTDKASGIVNDANDYANETMNNPAYPLELFQRVITVSLETMKIVRALPELDLPD